MLAALLVMPSRSGHPSWSGDDGDGPHVGGCAYSLPKDPVGGAVSWVARVANLEDGTQRTSQKYGGRT
jgi:hypothetical protein